MEFTLTVAMGGCSRTVLASACLLIGMQGVGMVSEIEGWGFWEVTGLAVTGPCPAPGAGELASAAGGPGALLRLHHHHRALAAGEPLTPSRPCVTVCVCMSAQLLSSPGWAGGQRAPGVATGPEEPVSWGKRGVRAPAKGHFRVGQHCGALDPESLC